MFWEKKHPSWSIWPSLGSGSRSKSSLCLCRQRPVSFVSCCIPSVNRVVCIPPTDLPVIECMIVPIHYAHLKHIKSRREEIKMLIEVLIFSSHSPLHQLGTSRCLYHRSESAGQGVLRAKASGSSLGVTLGEVGKNDGWSLVSRS